MHFLGILPTVALPRLFADVAQALFLFPTLEFKNVFPRHNFSTGGFFLWSYQTLRFSFAWSLAFFAFLRWFPPWIRSFGHTSLDGISARCLRICFGILRPFRTGIKHACNFLGCERFLADALTLQSIALRRCLVVLVPCCLLLGWGERSLLEPVLYDQHIHPLLLFLNFFLRNLTFEHLSGWFFPWCVLHSQIRWFDRYYWLQKVSNAWLPKLRHFWGWSRASKVEASWKTLFFENFFNA